MKINKILAVAAMAIGFASCSSEGELTPTVDALKDTPLQINASVAGMQTRVGYDANSVPDKFYLKVDQYFDDTTYDYDVVMKLEDGKWVAYDVNNENKPVQMLRAGFNITCYLYAYTFKKEGNSGGVQLAVLADQSTEENVKESDYLYSWTLDDNKEVKNIDLTLEHQMSKLSLELTLGDEYEAETNPVTDIQVVGTVPNIVWNSGYINKATEAKATDITPCFVSYTKPTVDAKNAKVNYEVILAPQTVEAKTFGVEFKISGKTYHWYSDAAVKLEKGTQYTLQLTAGKDQVNPVKVTSKAWNTNDNTKIETF